MDLPGQKPGQKPNLPQLTRRFFWVRLEQKKHGPGGWITNWAVCGLPRIDRFKTMVGCLIEGIILPQLYGDYQNPIKGSL